MYTIIIIIITKVELLWCCRTQPMNVISNGANYLFNPERALYVCSSSVRPSGAVVAVQRPCSSNQRAASRTRSEQNRAAAAATTPTTSWKSTAQKAIAETTQVENNFFFYFSSVSVFAFAALPWSALLVCLQHLFEYHRIPKHCIISTFKSLVAIADLLCDCLICTSLVHTVHEAGRSVVRRRQAGG